MPEYWVPDPQEGCVWIWRFAAGATEPERVVGRYEWKPEDAAEALRLDTAELLRPF